MKVEASMAWSRDPVRMEVAASPRKVAVQIVEPGLGGGTVAITLTRSDAQRLAGLILAALKEQ